MQTSNYAAEFGQAGGGLFNITMKSGTNQFHGSGFEYFVNEDLNAGDPFSFNNGTLANPSGGKFRPRNRRNDFGGTFGGPVRIPKVYNGRNKTFFFYSYEYYKRDSGADVHRYIAQRAVSGGELFGDFAQRRSRIQHGLGRSLRIAVATDALGRPVFANEIYDPATRTSRPPAWESRIRFPNNMIPLTRFSPVAVAIQNVLPTLSNSALYNNYNGSNPGSAHHVHSFHQSRSDPRRETEAVVLLPAHQHAAPSTPLPTATRTDCRTDHRRARFHSHRRSGVPAEL